MRREPTGRIPLGVLGLLAALLVYGVAVARWVSPWIAGWPALAQAGV